jgi:hypothetical protein
MTRERHHSGRSSAVWLALATSVSLLANCGSGDELFLGSTNSGRGGGEGNSSGTAACGAEPCADHLGTRIFLQPETIEAAASIFSAAKDQPPSTEPSREPALVYPASETMFPLNVSNIRHEWSSAGNTLFELEFVGPKTRVLVYTLGSSFTPTAEQWDWIAESNRGAAVTLSIRGLDPARPDQAFRSSPIQLYFSSSAVDGAIYYWSTDGKGVMRALVSDTHPVKFYTDPQATDAAKCTGCHTLSRDGKRLAVGYDGEQLRVVSVPEREVVLPTSSGAGGASGGDTGKTGAGKLGPAIPAAWTTFSPDGTLLLVAAAGKLKLIDAATGVGVGAGGGNLALPSGSVATHPDWSALGTEVVFTLGSTGGGKSVEGGAIARMSYSDGSFGIPEVIVPNAGGDDNNYYPVFSPDSRFVAYVNAKGKSEDAASATLRLIDLTSRQIFDLTRLNQRVNAEDGMSKIGNSMPTWAPSTSIGVFWLAFSSLRPYATLRARDKKKDQIWIAAIDTKLPDPGFAAFWAPFQSVDQGNHRAFWTHAIEDRLCRCADVCNDQIDNDCDGTADEADCIVGCADREICGDGIDNDCDCIVDDCAIEVCDDGMDNDGDGHADADDPTCTAL